MFRGPIDGHSQIYCTAVEWLRTKRAKFWKTIKYITVTQWCLFGREMDFICCKKTCCKIYYKSQSIWTNSIGHTLTTANTLKTRNAAQTLACNRVTPILLTSVRTGCGAICSVKSLFTTSWKKQKIFNCLIVTGETIHWWNKSHYYLQQC